MGDKRAMKREAVDMALAYKKSCPFIGNSFSECYCNSMNSLQAEDALYYCGKIYVECPIYKEKSDMISLSPDNAIYQKKEANKS